MTRPGTPEVNSAISAPDQQSEGSLPLVSRPRLSRRRFFESLGLLTVEVGGTYVALKTGLIKPGDGLSLTASIMETGDRTLGSVSTAHAAVEPKGAATQKIERKAESLPVTAMEIFSNIADPDQNKARTELESNPARQNAFFITTDGNGLMTGFHTIREDANAEDTYHDYFRYDALTGKFTEWRFKKPGPLGMYGLSVVASNDGHINIGGEKTRNSGDSVNLFTEDWGANWREMVVDLGVGKVDKQKIVEGKGKDVIRAYDTGTSTVQRGVIDMKTGKLTVVPTAFAEINLTAVNPNEDIVYETDGYGLQKVVVNLDTSGATAEPPIFTDLGRLSSPVPLADGTQNALVSAYSSKTVHKVDLGTHTVTESIPVGNWMDNNPNKPAAMILGSNRVAYFKIKGNYIVSSGTVNVAGGQAREVFTIRDKRKDLKDPNNLTVYFPEPDKQATTINEQDMQWANIDNKVAGWFENLSGLGTVFIETNIDGSPKDGVKPIYVKNPAQAVKAPLTEFRTFAPASASHNGLNSQ
jgi:hypothetical protein